MSQNAADDERADPIVHRQREQRLVQHVERLLQDDRLFLDTAGGTRAVTSLIREVHRRDRGVELKRAMSDAGVYDREVQARMPVGEVLEVTLKQKRWWSGTKPVGRLRVLCESPVRQLLKGEKPDPMDKAGLKRTLELPLPSEEDGVTPLRSGEPVTTVVLSTSGFTRDAHEMADRSAGHATILVEPNEAGGWTVTGPPELRETWELFDPEDEDEKRQRVRGQIDAARTDLVLGGLSADRVAARAQVPQWMVEAEFTRYALENPGFASQRLGGQMMLYREGSTLAGAEGFEPTASGETMPFWERVKGIFGRPESRDTKIARLSAEKARLSRQREIAYAEIEAVEKKEAELTASFQNATSLAQRRIATEISQLRKRVERYQQVVATIDKKINIIETGVHNLEMEVHVDPAKLKDLEEAAQASENVDVGMATLDQLSEQADSVSVVGTEMSMGAQDVLAELQAKFAKDEPAKQQTGTPTAQGTTAGPERTAPERSAAQRDTTNRTAATPERRRGEAAEPG